MSWRSDRFNGRMRSLDAMLSGFADASKSRAFSDCGRGVRRVLDALDYDEAAETAAAQAEDAEREQRLENAVAALVAAGLGHTVPTILLIAENGRNRGTSLAHVPPRTYFRHRAKLLAFFAH